MAEVHLYFRTQIKTDKGTAEALREQAEDLKAALVAAGAEPQSLTVAVLPTVEDVVPSEPEPEFVSVAEPSAPAEPESTETGADAGEGDSDVR